MAGLLRNQRQEGLSRRKLIRPHVTRRDVIKIAILRARDAALIGVEYARAVIDRRTAADQCLRHGISVIQIERCEMSVLSDDVVGCLAGDGAAIRIVDQIVALRCEPARAVGAGHIGGVVREDGVLQHEVRCIAAQAATTGSGMIVSDRDIE